MSSKALQALVKTINQDEKTRGQFQADPESVMSRFVLSKEEKRAVLSSRRQIGLGVAGSSRLDSTIGPMGYWL